MMLSSQLCRKAEEISRSSILYRWFDFQRINKLRKGLFHKEFNRYCRINKVSFSTDISYSIYDSTAHPPFFIYILDLQKQCWIVFCVLAAYNKYLCNFRDFLERQV